VGSSLIRIIHPSSSSSSHRLQDTSSACCLPIFNSPLRVTTASSLVSLTVSPSFKPQYNTPNAVPPNNSSASAFSDNPAHSSSCLPPTQSPSPSSTTCTSLTSLHLVPLLHLHLTLDSAVYSLPPSFEHKERHSLQTTTAPPSSNVALQTQPTIHSIVHQLVLPCLSSTSPRG